MNNTPLDQDFDFQNTPNPDKTLYDANQNWALLVTYDFTSDAELLTLTDALKEAEIPNHVMDKSTGLVNPLLSGQKGAVQLYVAQNRWDEAMELYSSTHKVTQQIYDEEDAKTKNDKWYWIKMLVRIVLIAFLLKSVYNIYSIVNG